MPDLDVRIDGLARWRATADVARRYQDGRIFLAGDAAHVMPPNGGFGGNTGIHDAHNLAWKLAYVLAGHAAPALLETYEAERRPVGQFTVEQAYTRYVRRTAPHLGVDEAPPLAPDFDVELGYLYRSRAIISADDDDRVHADPRSTRGRPGSRAPHVWVEIDGRRASTIDLAANTFTVFTGHAGAAWCDAARTVAARHPGLVLHAHDIGDAGAFGDASVSRSPARCSCGPTGSWPGAHPRCPTTRPVHSPECWAPCSARRREPIGGSTLLVQNTDALPIQLRAYIDSLSGPSARSDERPARFVHLPSAARTNRDPERAASRSREVSKTPG